MKKLMLLALALVIGTASLFAANVNPDDSKKDMREFKTLEYKINCTVCL